MGKRRDGRLERAKDIDLARGVVQVVVAADDVGDAHIEIVDHHRQVIGGRPVGAQEDEIVELSIPEGDPPPDQVLDHDLAIERVLEADHRLGIRIGRAAFGSAAATAVIARFLLARHLLGP